MIIFTGTAKLTSFRVRKTRIIISPKDVKQTGFKELGRCYQSHGSLTFLFSHQQETSSSKQVPLTRGQILPYNTGRQFGQFYPIKDLMQT